MSESLRPHGLQHVRLPCQSPSPGACSNSCPLSQWCHPTISFSIIPFSSCLQSCAVIRVFSNESVFCIRWPKYWSFSFSISPSNEYSGLISFRIDWFDLLAVHLWTAVWQLYLNKTGRKKNKSKQKRRFGNHKIKALQLMAFYMDQL